MATCVVGEIRRLTNVVASAKSSSCSSGVSAAASCCFAAAPPFDVFDFVFLPKANPEFPLPTVPEGCMSQLSVRFAHCCANSATFSLVNRYDATRTDCWESRSLNTETLRGIELWK